MSRDDLRFGDSSAGSGSRDPTETMEMLIELGLQGAILLVILYVLLAMLDTMIFDGAIPIV